MLPGLIQGSSQVRPGVFRYRSLPRGHCIRLLSLAPGTGPLRCSLFDHELDQDNQDYQALSYVWGSEGPSQALICEGRLLAISRNLATALRALRHTKQVKVLWVDWICINQQDDVERSQQVSIMGDIYSSAESVLVWLGDDHLNEAQECFNLIKNSVKILEQLLSKHDEVSRIPQSSWSAQLCADADKWRTVTRLFERVWFTRIWVVQEVGLARRAIVGCGNARLNWSDLVELALFVAWRPDLGLFTGYIRSGPIWDTFESIWASFGNSQTWRNDKPLCKQLNQTESSDSVTFVDLLNNARFYGATDSRDYVYAFLSHPRALLSRSNDSAIRYLEPDYRATVEEVYLGIAATFLETNCYGWTVLSAVDHSKDLSAMHESRPSWVPRWDEAFRVYWLGYSQNWYRAGGEQPDDFRHCIQVDRSSGHLLMRCFLVDIVSITSTMFEVDVSSQDSRQQKFSSSDMFSLLQHNSIASPYGLELEQQEDAYSLALVAGRAADDGPAEDNPIWHRSVFNAYKRISINQFTTVHPPVVSGTDSSDLAPTQNDRLDVDATAYEANVRRALTNRRIFQTGRGYFGVGHREMKAGDICVVVKGANVPFLLRQTGQHQRPFARRPEDTALQSYQLVGECYVQGIMRGELLSEVGKEGSVGLKESEVLLV